MRWRWLAILAMLWGMVVGGSATAQFTQGTTGSTGGFGGGNTGGSTGGFGGGNTGGFGGGNTGGFGGGNTGGFGGGNTGGNTGGFGGGGTGSSSLNLSSGSFTDVAGILGANTNQGNAGANSIGGTSFLGRNYAYPMARGLPNIAPGGTGANAASTAFGSPLFTVNGTGTTGTTGGRTGSFTTSGGLRGNFGNTGTAGQAGRGGLATGTTGQNSFASSEGQLRTIPYVTEIAFERTVASPAVVGQQVQTMLAGSSRLTNSNVQATAQGSTIVLSGTPANQREAAVIAAMAGLNPGVRKVEWANTPR